MWTKISPHNAKQTTIYQTQCHDYNLIRTMLNERRSIRTMLSRWSVRTMLNKLSIRTMLNERRSIRTLLNERRSIRTMLNERRSVRTMLNERRSIRTTLWTRILNSASIYRVFLLNFQIRLSQTPKNWSVQITVFPVRLPPRQLQPFLKWLGALKQKHWNFRFKQL